MSYARRGILIVALMTLAFQAGCSYMQDRGRDAMDILDIGITVSKKPGFALYIDFFKITPIGFSHVDGWWLGLGHRQFGALELTDRSWGALLWGSEKQQIGEFDPYHPYLMWRSVVRKLEVSGRPLPTEAQRYNNGIIRMIAQDNTPPPLAFISCKRLIHLGWIGFGMNVRPVEIVDLVAGITTLDISGDDIGKP